jgi:(S)-3,5-dihydroxyphenylglycine transaminase
MRYPEAISFAPGRPYDGFFDVEEVIDRIRLYLEHLAGRGRSPEQVANLIYQYGPTAGLIRDLIADSLRVDEGIDVPPEAVVVTVGSQEAMLLTLRALVRGPDDVVLAVSPCYVGITGAARLLDVTLVPVEEGENGIDGVHLEAAIAAQRACGRAVRAVYLVPDHSNPSGATVPLRTRHELIAVAERQDVLLLEDSPYRLVSPGPVIATLKSLDRVRRVIHLGSFSKTLFPGARVGYVVADQLVVDDEGRTSLLADELTKIKSMVTVNTSSLSQAAVGGALLASAGRISALNVESAAHYAGALRETLDRLDEELPPSHRARLGVRWNEPAGGFFLVVQVPFAADNAALTRSAEDFGVIWTPMSYFYPEAGGERALRLSISYLSADEIKQGVHRLAQFIESEAGRTARGAGHHPGRS